MRLGPLYHWSPSDRYDDILYNGLRPSAPPTVATETLPHVCLGFDAGGAWAISGGMPHVEHVPLWDLWLVDLADSDAVTVRPEYGPEMCEVQVGNQITAGRLWWVGQRGRR